ncbi:protein EMBRYO SAC DEVELOPMENT ARREST 30 [Selaginella moellendorffii]|nr:protein EMBRYO SAC DEVELOPMENT ARREST 30 [Selaginella moellendorffii]|eukprot:XP_002972444.2 protein EMBRYO SAC DEVELOPMENT ARREST 30 [Selaginella moellendorffii]
MRNGMAFKSSLKTVAVLGMALSMISLAAHFFAARYYTWARAADELQQPGGVHPAPILATRGFLHAEIRGDFHEIRSSICDLIVVARLLNVTLVVPKLREVVAKQISSKFRGFDYLYDEQHFVSVLSNDVPVVTRLPKRLRQKTKNQSYLVVSSTASVDFYVQDVLPEIEKEGVVGLSVSGGGCLQSLLGTDLEHYQRLRCRVAFHALKFRQEIEELSTKMLARLKTAGKPFMALHLGLERDTLAYHGCAERFQDVHTELIQYRRAKMIKNGIVRGELNVDSEMQWLNGSCPLMPDEVGVLLRSLGYKQTSRIYISGVEVFGGQRILLPLRSMYPNLEDRTTLTTARERFTVYGEEPDFPPPPPFILPKINEKARLAAWEKAGPRPRPLPPPAGRPKYSHELEGWWGWIGESDTEPAPALKDMRIRSHKLLWQALDYIICTQADAFFSAFDEDKSGHPNFASLVMGHRVYAGASRRTYRPERKPLAKLLMQVRDHMYDPGREWMAAARNSILKSSGEEGIAAASSSVRPLSFLSHPLPECVCSRNQSQSEADTPGRCPEWSRRSGLAGFGDTEEQDMDFMDSVEEEELPLNSTAAAAVDRLAVVDSAERSPSEDAFMAEVDEDNDPND